MSGFCDPLWGREILVSVKYFGVRQKGKGRSKSASEAFQWHSQMWGTHCWSPNRLISASPWLCALVENQLSTFNCIYVVDLMGGFYSLYIGLGCMKGHAYRPEMSSNSLPH